MSDACDVSRASKSNRGQADPGGWGPWMEGGGGGGGGGSPCRMSNLRNGNVAVSNLVVQTNGWGFLNPGAGQLTVSDGRQAM